MTDRNDTEKRFDNADQEIVYLKRIIDRMQKRLLRQEKLDDMNRHQTKWAMQQLEQARKLAEQANHAKTDFLANMSHEIRTPLNIVLGMGELLAGTRLDENQHHYLQSLRLSGEHLLRLINDILDFSRIESGTLGIHQDSFSLSDLLSEVEAIGTHLASEKGLRFVLLNEGALEPNRIGDSRKIKQVLINLLDNAIKYTDRGTVTLAVEKSAEDGGAGLQLSVSDTGVGIPKDQCEKIFERFTQVHHSFMKGSGGIGLGLAISHRLVAAMGGQIDLYSEVGAGSTFTVKMALPSAEQEPVSAAISQGRAVVDAVLPPLKILVVDDIYLNFELIRSYFKDTAVTLDYAGDGRQAQRIFLDNGYDAILMDLRMPVMGGVEAIKHIRARESQFGLGSTPAIAMTAHAFAEQETEYLASGFDAVLIKPFTKSDLVRLLNRLIVNPASASETSVFLKETFEEAGPSSGALASMVPLVLESFSEEIEKLETALHNHNQESLQTTCHALKGLAGLYGYTRLADLLEHLEGSARKREYRTAHALAEALRCHVNELREKNLVKTKSLRN
jgi:signal transduction histidine kinase/CheY-like chemotaxis protein/HPt (histidine-containing phosphotransfer) domain-containing protein